MATAKKADVEFEQVQNGMAYGLHRQYVDGRGQPRIATYATEYAPDIETATRRAAELGAETGQTHWTLLIAILLPDENGVSDYERRVGFAPQAH